MCGGDGKVIEMRFGIDGEIGDEKLIDVNEVMKRKTGELKVNVDEDLVGGSGIDFR